MERQNVQKERSLAWFKLADLIARGEREKALSVFRLLAHSLPDRAYALQLEGDILWYLDDKGAVEKHKQAAFLYQKEKRWVDAIAIYEHLFTQNDQSCDVLAHLCAFYAVLDWPEKFHERCISMFKLFENNTIDEAQFVRAFRDIIHITRSIDDSKHPWFLDDIHKMLSRLPDNIALRLKGLL